MSLHLSEWASRLGQTHLPRCTVSGDNRFIRFGHERRNLRLCRQLRTPNLASHSTWSAAPISWSTAWAPLRMPQDKTRKLYVARGLRRKSDERRGKRINCARSAGLGEQDSICRRPPNSAGSARPDRHLERAIERKGQSVCRKDHAAVREMGKMPHLLQTLETSLRHGSRVRRWSGEVFRSCLPKPAQRLTPCPAKR